MRELLGGVLVSILTDASWCPRTKAVGMGYWIVCNRGRKVGGSYYRMRAESSGVAEMAAACNAIKVAVTTGHARGGDRILLQLDSEEAIKKIMSITPLVNTAEFIRKEIRRHTVDLSIRLEVKHVKAHTNGNTPRTYVNNQCDLIAKKYMKQARALIKKGAL